MYYNRILRIWVVDPLDWFLLSALIGSLAAWRLKNYLTEEEAKKRLINSIIKKSKLVKSKTPILSSKEAKIKQISRFALVNRGGQIDESDVQLSNELFKLAQDIKNLVERLAIFLKERELKGVAKIFFKSGRLILQLILYKCNITISYGSLTEGLSTQVILITATAGGTAGFIVSWFSAGAALISPVLLSTVLAIRSVTQQIISERDYVKFKTMLNKMFDDDELKDTIRVFVTKFEDGTPASGTLEMESLDFDKEPKLKHNFNLKSDENFEKSIKVKMEEELGLIENPTKEQLQKIIQKKKPKGKTVLFKDFIRENPYEGADL